MAHTGRIKIELEKRLRVSGSFFDNRLESIDFKMLKYIERNFVFFSWFQMSHFLFAYTIVAPQSSHGVDVFDFTLGPMFCVVDSAK